MKTLIRITCLCFLCMLHLSPLNAQQSPPPEADDFDFWIGDWTVYNTVSDTIVGYSTISSVVNGVAIQENYRSVGGYVGTSLNKYNAVDKRWEQYYVDNTGLTLHILGHFKDGKMTLSNSQLMNGVMTDNKMTWTDNEDGTVRQVWEQKRPEQEEWTLLFDGTYKPKE